MRKLRASIWKEFLLLISDKVGLLLMYFMPILLVFVITLVQDSTFRLVNENKLEILLINKDKGGYGDSLIHLLQRSGTFQITVNNSLDQVDIEKKLLNGNELIALQIPAQFSQNLSKKSEDISTQMLAEFGISEPKSEQKKIEMHALKMYYDPVLQESFRYSLLSTVYSHLSVLENRIMIESMYREMGYDELPQSLEAQFLENRIEVEQHAASSSAGAVVPNSTQHNVPAWSIFAMFFMVISLGGNIVKERLSGSFVRLQTIPTSFSLVLISKLFVYLFVALTQLTIIFGIGKFIFPSIGLPALELPSNTVGLMLVSILSALAAISFAMLVGTYAKTQEQANGFGAITVIIFAAIGGIWVPSFVMPSYLQTIGNLSPLHWCLEGYYTLFLKGGDWYLLTPTLLFLILFILASQLLIYIRLKIQNYI